MRIKEKKLQSASVEDLKRIVTKMIKKALDDNERLVKLHRTVCNEWYSKFNEKGENKKLKNVKADEKLESTVKSNLIKSKKVTEEGNKIQKSRTINNEAFNEWKKAKTRAYKQEMTREHKGRKQELAEETLQLKIEKKKKDEEKKEWRKQQISEFYHQQKSQLKGWRKSINLELNLWLNQVDQVLHQKYLRERRFHVQSFYCQPTYYGTDIPQALFNFQLNGYN